jgi:hypothetical protein
MLSADGQFFGGYFIMSTEWYVCVSEAIQWAETLPHSFTVPGVSFIYFGPPPSVLLEYRCFPSYLGGVGHCFAWQATRPFVGNVARVSNCLW